MISLIWAEDEDHLIGSNNKMPWHYKEDLIYYKEKTKNENVVMGYNTYLSLKGYYKDKPFPYKKTFVVSLEKIDDPNVEGIYDLDNFLKNLNFDIFVAGGKMMFNYFIPYANYLYVSKIPGHHEGDIYMDPINMDQFELFSSTKGEKVTFEIYKRK